MTVSEVTPRPAENVVVAEGLVKHFPAGHGIFSSRRGDVVHAVDGVSLSIGQGETVALVGESGSGKTTLARLILRLLPPTRGVIRFEGRDITNLSGAELRRLRRRMQLVFQDPMASLNPRLTVGRIVSAPLRIHRVPGDHRRMAHEIMARVGLSPDHYDRYPHEFSGGQRQRVGIARALVLRPQLIVCDEPVSALDVSIRAQILNLLVDLQRETGVSYLLISHDLGVVRHLADRVAVMYLGRIVEVASRDDLFNRPCHPYTRALLAAVPVPDPAKESIRQRVPLSGDTPSPVAPPPGCRFNPRCPIAEEICRHHDPALEIAHAGSSHAAACHFAVR